MGNFNPYMSNREAYMPNRNAYMPSNGQNQTYADPAQNYGWSYDGQSSQPNMSVPPSYDGPDAWMHPGYPTRGTYDHNGYTPSPSHRQAMSQQEICRYTRVMGGLGGAMSGAWSGVKLGARICPNNQFKPACMAASGAAGAYAGATGADIAGLNTSSCQGLVRRDAQGNMHYGSGFDH